MKTIMKMDVYKHKGKSSLLGTVVSLILILAVLSYGIIKVLQDQKYYTI
jgi:hypothetical protein